MLNVWRRVYNLLEASRFFIKGIYTGLNPVSGIFRNSKFVNVYSFACFTSFGLGLFSVGYYYYYKWWTYKASCAIMNLNFWKLD